MADFTPNYNLKKPLRTEYYNVADANGNSDIVDTQLKAMNDRVDLVEDEVDALEVGKVDKVVGKQLSDENYTLIEKNKVANLPADTNAQLAEIVKVSTNLFDASNVFTGKSIDSTTGQLIDNTDYASSGPIKIKPSTNYYLKTISAGKIAWYTGEDMFISSETIISTDGYVSAISPGAAVYARVQTKILFLDETQLNEGTTALEYEPYYKSISNDLSLPLKRDNILLEYNNGLLAKVVEGAAETQIHYLNDNVSKITETKNGLSVDSILNYSGGMLASVTKEVLT